MKKALIFSMLAALGLSACSKPQIVQPPKPPLAFVIMPSREMSSSSMETIEGMLTDYGFTTVSRALLDTIFNGLEIPPTGPLEPALAAEIAQRSHAEIMITLNWRKNSDELAYESGAYDLQMRWISLPDGQIAVSRTKALYFMPRGPEVKVLMKACLDAYRAAHPSN